MTSAQSSLPIRLNIVYIIARFIPFSGGAEEYCFQVAKHMAALGHNVTVLTTDATPNGERLAAEEIMDGVKVTRIHRWNQQLDLGFYPALLSKLLHTPADVVHVANGPGFVWQEFCMFWKKVSSPKTLFLASPHGPFLATPETHTGLKKILATVAKYTVGLWYQLTWKLLFNHVFADNPKQIEWLQRDYHFSTAQVHLLPIGIDEMYVQRQSTNLEHKPASPLLITSLARLARYKGFLDIVEAVHLLQAKPELPDFKVMFLGRPEPGFIDELRAKIRAYNLESRIEILETPSNELRDQNLMQSQITILASSWEAAGISLMEAMASGNAIVTTTGNEAAELLIPNQANGFIYPTHDTNSLAEILQTLIINTQQRQQMQAASLQVVQSFRWDKIIPEYVRVLSGKLSIQK